MKIHCINVHYLNELLERRDLPYKEVVDVVENNYNLTRYRLKINDNDNKRIFYEINEIILITSLVIIWYSDMSCNTITVTYFIHSVDISLSNFN